MIDFHTHIFPDALAPKVIPHLQSMSHTQAFLNGTIDHLIASMTEANVEKSIILPVASAVKQVQTCNDFAKQVCENHPQLHSFGAMHPQYEAYASELKRIKDMGLKGIKLHPNYQEIYFDDIRYKRIVEKASELDLIVVIHAGVDIGLPEPVYATPERIKNVLDDVHPQKLVLAHMGGWQLWEDVMQVLGGEAVWLDTSYCLGSIRYQDGVPKPYEMMAESCFLRMVETFGSKRILFGSDSPWDGQKEAISLLQSLPLSEKQKEDILTNNAKQLLEL